MEYRLSRDLLFEIFGEWNRFLKRRVHVIACGGTARTLLGVKPSTKDIDLMVPESKEHAYLLKQLAALGYERTTGAGWRRSREPFQFDIFKGNCIHTTELMNSPLENTNHTLLKAFSRLCVGILNDYDLIASKLMRGTRVDFDDCLELAAARWNQIDLDKLVRHFHHMVAFDVGEERLRPNIDYFIDLLKEKGIYGG